MQSSRIDDDDYEEEIHRLDFMPELNENTDTKTPTTSTSTNSTRISVAPVNDGEEKFDSIVTSILSKFKSRASFGKKKYGTDLDRTDLNVFEWIQHAQEEHMDAILYLEKLGVELKKNNMNYPPQSATPANSPSLNPFFRFISSITGDGRQPNRVNHPTQLLDMMQSMLKNDKYDESYTEQEDIQGDDGVRIIISDLDAKIDIDADGCR